jgi:hypothetical protein
MKIRRQCLSAGGSGTAADSRLNLRPLKNCSSHYILQELCSAGQNIRPKAAEETGGCGILQVEERIA